MKFLGLLFHHGGKRFLKEHHSQRDQEHNHQHRRSRKRVPAHIQHNHRSKSGVKYQASRAVGVKPYFFRIMGPYAVDNVKDHTQQDDSHANGNRHHKHRIQPADKRQIRHRLLGAEPQGVYDILKAEDTSKQQAEDNREETAAGYNARQPDFFKTIQQKSADQKAKALSCISEHKAKENRIGNSNQNRGVDFIVGGKAVHLHIHLKRLKKPRIFHLRRRRACNIPPVVLQDTERIRILLDFFSEGPGISFRHPSAEDIEVVGGVHGAGSQLAHIKIDSETLQTDPGPCKLLFLLLQNRFYRFLGLPLLGL